MRLIVAKTPLYMVACVASSVVVYVCCFQVSAMHCVVEPFSALSVLMKTPASCFRVASVLFFGNVPLAWLVHVTMLIVGICVAVPAREL